jgi:hypothetical protein
MATRQSRLPRPSPQGAGGLKPMSEFDPSEPAVLHEVLSDRIVAWSPDWRSSFEKNAWPYGPGVVVYDGLVFDGWRTAHSEAISYH